jgi:DNA invertase Pin-like site-specific DNA recombinase
MVAFGSPAHYFAGGEPRRTPDGARLPPGRRHADGDIDRLARGIGDLQDIVRAVRARGASAADRHQHGGGKCFLDMVGVFAEFETNLRRERQLEGIAKAKAAGVYNGRPASIDDA